MKIINISILVRQVAKTLIDLNSSSEPVLITEHGKPTAYLLNINDYEQTQRRLDILEGIARAETAILRNQTFTQVEAEERLNK
ncbi:MAG: type II toxin-antitoxin system Phd/YefM family antitoxin [Xanthomonadales bacterium]|nr:type II toxin-antitoxin system Phd/YefM family antitoxin [Xanthomonadales bacterium]